MRRDDDYTPRHLPLDGIDQLGRQAIVIAIFGVIGGLVYLGF